MAGEGGPGRRGAGTTGSRHAVELPSLGRRGVAAVVIAIGLVHSVLIMIWVMPVNPLRDAVGNQRLTSYVYPYFDQSWSVFAPTPRRGGENVQIRAYTGDVEKKDGKVTDWYDVTGHEDERISYLLNPSRIHSATRRMGGSVNAAIAELNARQKTLLGGNYVQTPVSTLQAKLLDANTGGAAGRKEVLDLMTQDVMLTKFATLYGTALWGDDITMVQLRIGHRAVPNYAQRNEVSFLDVPFDYVTFGWRKAAPGSAAAQDAFDGYVS